MSRPTASGWWAPNPFFQKEPDQLPDSELVMTPPSSNALPADCYPTEAKAWEAMRHYLTAGLQQARRDVADGTAATPAVGSESARHLERQRRAVAFAERALQLCDAKLKALGRR